MLVIPAIDIFDGKVVRLEKGDMENRKKYFDNPLDVALMFTDEGVERIHIVDLNGAKTGENVNFKIIEKIVAKTGLVTEVGGGIRDFARVNAYFELGVNFPILGTATVKSPDFVREVLTRYPKKIILGVDAKDGFVATDGWYKTSEKTVMDILCEYEGYEPESVIYTDISRDGMLEGINIESTVDVAEKSGLKIIASGGLKDLGDIEALNDTGIIYGCIVGKAFYEGKVSLKEALKIGGAFLR